MPSITKLANMLYRYTQGYTNEVLLKYRLSSGTFPYLLILYEKEGINQNQISKELNIDKAMSTRAVKKLIELGYLRKIEDYKDSRAYKLYLTDRGKAIVPFIKEELCKWNEVITKDLSEQENEEIAALLTRILKNAQKYKNKT